MYLGTMLPPLLAVSTDMLSSSYQKQKGKNGWAEASLFRTKAPALRSAMKEGVVL